MELERVIILAWKTAEYQRAKRMPSLESVLRRLNTGDAPPTEDDVKATKSIADEGAEILEKKRRLKKEQQAKNKKNG